MIDIGVCFTGLPLTSRMRAFGITGMVMQGDNSQIGYRDAETGIECSRAVPRCVAEWLSQDD